jgi:hypothetical protein
LTFLIFIIIVLILILILNFHSAAFGEADFPFISHFFLKSFYLVPQIWSYKLMSHRYIYDDDF